jgi:ATP-dependent protease ClpP protease subunit
VKESKKKFKLEIKNQVKNKAELIMYGDVSPWDISAEMLQAEMSNLDSSVTELDVRIFSGGGDVFEGIAIYNILKRSDRKITMYVDGLAASIASIIILAADEIVIGEGSQIMIHSPYCFCMGNSSELQGVIDRLEMTEREMVKIYQKVTGLSETEIIGMMANETWFNDDQAVEFGFATMKADNKTNFNIAASVKGCDWIRKKELAKVNLEFQNGIQDNINKFNDILARK